jgi:hypothetical protein
MIPISRVPLAAAITMALFAGGLQAAPVLTPVDTLDKDENGTVSQAEYEAGRKAHMENRARVGRPIRNPDAGPKFSDIDANGDGEATLDEFRAARMTIMAKRRAAIEMARRERMKQVMENMQDIPRPPMGPPPFKAVDANGDGMISPVEYNNFFFGKGQ